MRPMLGFILQASQVEFRCRSNVLNPPRRIETSPAAEAFLHRQGVPPTPASPQVSEVVALANELDRRRSATCRLAAVTAAAEDGQRSTWVAAEVDRGDVVGGEVYGSVWGNLIAGAPVAACSAVGVDSILASLSLSPVPRHLGWCCASLVCVAG